MIPDDELRAGCAALGVHLPEDSLQKLLAYLGLLAKWNRTYNLTAVRDEQQMVVQHLLDSLAVLPLIENSALAIRQLADIGTGAGLPGLVLAIAAPGLQVASVEASQKKAAFQQQARIELGLANVTLHCARVEAVTGTFDAVISRAFSSLAEFVRLAGHLSHRLLAMKGVFPTDEVAALPSGWALTASHELFVPGLDARRHLLVLEKS